MTGGAARVLFLCTGNSARSQMGEALLRHLSGDGIVVASAGSQPRSAIHPKAREVMRRRYDLEMSGQHPKRVSSFGPETFDFVITVCDRAAESCPVFTGEPQRLHWSLEDPADDWRDADAQAAAFERTATELEARIRGFLADPAVAARLRNRGEAGR